MSTPNARYRQGENSERQSEGLASSATHRAKEYMDQGREYFDQGREMLSEYPMSSTAVAFGLGVGVGLLLAVAMTESRPTYSSRSEIMGRRVLDALSQILPERLSQHLG